MDLVTKVQCGAMVEVALGMMSLHGMVLGKNARNCRIGREAHEMIIPVEEVA